MPGIRWGQAKREVIANWPLISLRLDQTTLRQIWMELKGQGLVTCSQSNFYVQVKERLKPKVPQTAKEAGRDLVAVAAQKTPALVISPEVRSLSSGSIEPGPTARIEHDPRAQSLDALYGSNDDAD